MIKKQLIEALKKEKDMIEAIIRKTERSLSDAPEGSVLVKRYKNGMQFYFRKDADDHNGRYMPISERQLAIALLQKSYDKKILAAALQQKKTIENFLKKYHADALQEVYRKEGPLRQEHLRPYVITDEQYAVRWQAVEYERKPFREDAPVHYTDKQERVRSKSEVMIANLLYGAKMPYRYEAPLNLNGNIIHPDFTILRIGDRKEIYWEHLGMMDDMEYRNNAFNRIRLYEKHGIFPGDRLILTVETGRLPLNAAVIQQMINHYLM